MTFSFRSMNAIRDGVLFLLPEAPSEHPEERQRMKKIPVKADFSWAGAFAVTKDGLPYIGSVRNGRTRIFALGYGGNGITFSAIAAEIIRDMLLKKNNKNTELFGFNR